MHKENANFSRGWHEYKNGWGDPKGTEYWVGLEQIHQFTSRSSWALNITLVNENGIKENLTYNTFSVNNEASQYGLNIGGFENYNMKELDDRFGSHNGKPFSTSDADNDGCSGSCASTYDGAGWWHKCCCAGTSCSYYSCWCNRYDCCYDTILNYRQEDLDVKTKQTLNGIQWNAGTHYKASEMTITPTGKLLYLIYYMKTFMIIKIQLMWEEINYFPK